MYSNYEVQATRNMVVLILMMKLVASVGVLYGACLLIPQVMHGVEKMQMQPESLKVRVIANSSLAQDQQIKLQVVEEIQAVVNNNVQHEYDEVFFREVIHNVQEKFPNEKISLDVGDNLLPPAYQGTRFYPQSNMQSAVFIIGAGRGENWFCAAFSTVCQGSVQPKTKPLMWKMEEWLARRNRE